MKRIGLIHQPKTARSDPLAREIEQHLLARGIVVWRAAVDDDELIRLQSVESDLLVTLGGDGTIVATAHLTAGSGVPLLGINLGRLGFLAELEPEQAIPRLESVLQGQFWLEERMMLHAELVRGQRVVRTFEALNDVVTSRGRVAQVVKVEAHIDGQYLTTYYGDGVIVATPTGSTAYSMAAGGPVLDPLLRNIVVTPIAPHLAVGQSLVLHPEATVRLALWTGYEGTLTVDGQEDEEMYDGDAVVVTASAKTCQFVRMGERNYFYRTLLEKLR